MVDFEQVEAIASKLTPQYIAGFFDGEGSITVTKDLALQVVVSQSSELVLTAIARYFGCGSVCKHKPRRGHKVCYSLRWCGKNAEKVLVALSEFLVVKKAQAELGIKLSSLIGPRGSRVTEQQWQEREQIATGIKQLNDSHWSRRPASESVN